MIDMFRELRKHRFYHWTKRLLENNNHTLQLHMLGANLLLTDDPDNIKAIQDTQVGLDTGLGSLRCVSNRHSSGKSPNRRNSMRSSSTFWAMLFSRVWFLFLLINSKLTPTVNGEEWKQEAGLLRPHVRIPTMLKVPSPNSLR